MILHCTNQTLKSQKYIAIFLDQHKEHDPLIFSRLFNKIKITFDKVQLFQEGHKNLRHLLYGFDVY
jgi:hypothetical protein